MLAEQCGCHIDTLATGEGIVEAVFLCPPFSGLRPGMNGFEIIRAIRSLDGAKAMAHVEFGEGFPMELGKNKEQRVEGIEYGPEVYQ